MTPEAKDQEIEQEMFEDFFFDDDLAVAVAEFRIGRFEECIHHLDRAFDGQLSGLAHLYELEKARLKVEGTRS